MNKPQLEKLQFVICIRTDDPDLLTLWKIYQVIPDEKANQSNYLRIIDNEGEDYLYPANYFINVQFSTEVEQALLNVKN